MTIKSIDPLKSLKINSHSTRAATIGQPTEDGKIPVIFSTESPAVEYDLRGRPYYEILDHGKDSVDLSNLREGNRISFLESHIESPMVVLGSVVDIEIDHKTRVGIGVLEFSKSVRGQEAEGDFLNHHREFVSVGFKRILPPISVKKDKETGWPIVRLKWKLKEISGVHSPGDQNAKIMRSESDNNEPLEIQILSNRGKQTMDPEEIKKREAALKAKEEEIELAAKSTRAAKDELDIQIGEDKATRELQRREMIDELTGLAVEAYGLDFPDVHKESQRMKAEGIPASDFRSYIMKKFAERKASGADEKNSLGLTPREQVRFSLANAVRAMHNDTFNKDNAAVGFELEVSQEAEKLQPSVAPVGSRSLCLPYDITHSVSRAAGLTHDDMDFIISQLKGDRSMSVDQATKGGAWTKEGMTMSRFIDFLNAATITNQINITSVPGLTTDIDFAVLDAIQTAYMRGEHEAATLSDLTTNSRKMSPRLMSAGTKITYLLKTQASGLGIDAVIERKLALAMAIKRNQMFLYGTGQNKEPLGILAHTATNVVAGGTNGLAPTVDNYINMRTAVAAANAGDLPGQPMAFLMNSVTIGKNRRTPIESGQTARVMDINATSKLCIGSPVIESNLLRSNLTKGSGTALSECVFLNPAEVYEGRWGTTRVIIDEKTAASTDETITYIHEYIDYMLGHAVAVSIMNDLITT